MTVSYFERMSVPPYRLLREQLVPRPLDQVFAFFSKPENLEAITPAWLHFRIRAVDPLPVQTGTLIHYSLRIHGIPVRWTSRIIDWTPPHSFVDEQVRGPYRTWHHTHRFVAEGDSTRITDEVLYDLPFGILGRIVHRMKVKSDVEKIFAFREQKIREMFE
jgi:ligand-binding SRPBCC domain-containing protein